MDVEIARAICNKDMKQLSFEITKAIEIVEGVGRSDCHRDGW